jgi:hypothetical protein
MDHVIRTIGVTLGTQVTNATGWNPILVGVGVGALLVIGLLIVLAIRR